STALKHIDISPIRNLYASASSSTPSKPAMNMFSCFPRALRRRDKSLLFDIEVLERHPYTTQTFIPLSSSSSSSFREREGRYLVIVAPALPPTPDSPFQQLGPPDLDNTRAFWAHAGQAVTYGAGTWHAPMAVIGDERMDFVVMQFVNGVAQDDCQEVMLKKEGGLSVEVKEWDREGKARL
ncbi:MAG: hypothetical protein LQ341_007340, partial [Variospora aurantia]